MFLAARFDIGARLRDTGPNDLFVRFTPPEAKVAAKSMETWDIIADPIKTSKRNFIRKAQFGWGWDWGPALPTVGIWRPVQFERLKVAHIDGVRFTTVSTGAAVVAQVDIQVEIIAATRPLRLAIDLVAPDGKVAA